MKRVRRSREEWRAIVADWQGVRSVGEVAEEYGASPSSPYHWRSEFWDEAGARLDALFVPVEVAESRAATDRVAAVLRGEDVTLEILASAPASWVADVLRALDPC